MGRRRRALPEQAVEAVVDSLSPEGRGVARVEGKTVFIDGALPGERVRFRYRRLHRRYDEGEVEEVLASSPDRVEPRCIHFGVCGGCTLQHLAPEAQRRHKEAALLEHLERLGGVRPEEVLPPLTGPLWGYRHKARLGVRHVPKKGGVLVGFREKRNWRLAGLTRCEVLHPSVGGRVSALAELVQGLEAREHIAQIEVAVGDEAGALVFRNLVPLAAADLERLRAFGRETGLYLYLQPAGPGSIQALGEEAPLFYRLDGGAVTLRFRPTDFTQVNPELNRAMVALALELLAPAPEDRVLELFCGLGNFTLPLARRAGQVTAVEGEAALVERARDNAAAHGLTNIRFQVADLAEAGERPPWAGPCDKVLLDPPRSGAEAALAGIAATGAARIVYVSCNPATLARDAGILVREHGYRLRRAGIMDMFPHTAHVESIALLERD